MKKIEEEQAYVESLFIPRDQTPKGAEVFNGQTEGKKFKKQYRYGYNDVWLNLYSDGSAQCENLANGTDWYFAKSQDAFNYAKRISQRSKALSRMMG